MKTEKKQKQEKERQMYDTKERVQRIDNAKKKQEEAEAFLQKAKEITVKVEKEKLFEKSLERFRTAIVEMLNN